MATNKAGEVGVNIQFETTKWTVYPKPDDTVRDVVVKAARQFSQPSEDLSLIHRGLRLDDAEKLQDAVKGQATVFFLQKTVKRSKSMPPSKEKLLGYCKHGCSMVNIRPLITCKDCGCTNFTLDSHVDYFGEMKGVEGVCASCSKKEPKIDYQCVSCDAKGVTFLPCLRYNEHKLPCMKCGEPDQIVFLFNTCIKRHTMCLECFGTMCQQQLLDGEFKITEYGYTLYCPGPEIECYMSYIVDPHHFYAVDGKAFYDRVIDKSMEQFQERPPGDAVLCVSCKSVLDFTEPSRKTSDAGKAAGDGWTELKTLNLKRVSGEIKPLPKPVKKRITCTKCSNKAYCTGCKQLWHDGACLEVHKYEAYEIDRDRAEASCWPEEQPSCPDNPKPR